MRAKSSKQRCPALCMKLNNRPVGQVVTLSSLKRKVKSWASQIRQCCQRLATAATFLQKEQSSLGAMTRKWAPANSLHAFQCNTASIKKSLILI